MESKKSPLNVVLDVENKKKLSLNLNVFLLEFAIRHLIVAIA